MGEKQNQPSALVHTRNTSLDLVSTRRKPMKKLASPLTLGVAGFLCTLILISAHQNLFFFKTLLFPSNKFTPLPVTKHFKMIACSLLAPRTSWPCLPFPT